MKSVPDPTTTAIGGKPYTAPTREIWAWGIGALASHLLIQTYGQANLIFTVGFGLSPVLISWCMMLPRVVDGIADPIIGHLSDNTHTRWGRRKPYLVAGAVIGAIFLASVWWADPNWSSTAQFAYLLVLGTLFYVAYGVYTMAWTAVGYELTDDYNERSKVQAIASFFLALVSLSIGWMYWVALRPIFAHGVIDTFQKLAAAGFDWARASSVLAAAFISEGGTDITRSEIWGMRWISLIVGVVVIVSAFIAAVFCRERFTHTNPKGEHVALGKAIKTTMRNRPFVILILIKVCQILGERVAGALLVYLAIFYVCQGNKDLATKITGIGVTIGTFWGFALLPFMKPVTKWIGKKWALVAGASVSFVFALIQPFTLTPSYPYLLLLPALIVAPLITVGYTITNAIVPDICDVDELQTGLRREGLFTAVMGFMAKMEISLCFLLVGYLLSWSGIDMKQTVQPPEILNRLFWLCVLPNMAFTFAGLMLALKFPMTEEGMNEVRRKLDEERLAKAALGEPTDEVAEEFAHEHPREAVDFVEHHPEVVAEVEEEDRLRGSDKPGEDKLE